MHVNRLLKQLELEEMQRNNFNTRRNTEITLFPAIHGILAPVVQKADNFVHWISRYAGVNVLSVLLPTLLVSFAHNPILKFDIYFFSIHKLQDYWENLAHILSAG